MRAAAAFAALLLAACSPKSDAPAAYLSPDCAQPFEAQKAAVTAQRLTPAPKDPAEPYRFYSSPDGKASYLITEPDAPAHPAIMMQKVAGVDVVTTGCAYGDRAEYERLHAYLDSLKHWRRE